MSKEMKYIYFLKLWEQFIVLGNWSVAICCKGKCVRKEIIWWQIVLRSRSKLVIRKTSPYYILNQMKIFIFIFSITKIGHNIFSISIFLTRKQCKWARVERCFTKRNVTNDWRTNTWIFTGGCDQNHIKDANIKGITL